jgi:hypothetical protein
LTRGWFFGTNEMAFILTGPAALVTFIPKQKPANRNTVKRIKIVFFILPLLFDEILLDK